jgi:hypothetical protein
MNSDKTFGLAKHIVAVYSASNYLGNILPYLVMFLQKHTALSIRSKRPGVRIFRLPSGKMYSNKTNNIEVHSSISVVYLLCITSLIV